MGRSQAIAAVGLGAVLAGFAPVVAAQSVPAPPPSLPQGSLPTAQEVNPAAPDAAPPKSTVKVREQGAFRAGPCPLAQSDVKVAIRSITFTGPGGAALDPEILRVVQGITTGSDAQSISAVCTLRDEANFRLQHARYVAAVQIPPQTIDQGVLRLEVVTGRIVEVHVHGDAGPFEGKVRARIEQLKKLTPLNAAEAEKVLLQANDIPGLTMQMGLSPDTATGKPGDLIGDITVSYRRFALVGNVQNYNSTALGRETVYLRAEAYDLLNLDDRAYIAGSTTFDFRKQRTIQFGEAITLNSHNDHLAFVSTFAQSRPALTGLDLRTVSLIENLSYDHTFVRTTTASVIATGGFEYAEQRTKVYFAGDKKGQGIGLDRISTLYVRVDADKRLLGLDGSQKAEVSGGLELRKGIGILGATKPGVIVGTSSPSRFNGSGTPFIVRGHLSGVVNLGPLFELASTVQGQWADRELLNYDQFAIGNLTVGRGYDPGANTADKAFAAASEARFNLPLGPRVRGQIYGFYDWIHLWNRDPSSTERNRILRSVGGGARLTVINGLKLDVTYAHPLDPPLLTGTNVQRSPNRLMVSLTAQLVPFGFKF
ncbi:ShlB/FhaC/HecB family hemolysin secretion/activation protein [Novosphingobium sp.]|uniref:ShlB/FhaC/HecB family hemolysin secretion/activation protein n=1 Tax=Novosphingobium sp. TaxID=1874826 RepID=UPI0033405588